MHSAKDRLLFGRSGQASITQRESRETEKDNKESEQRPKLGVSFPESEDLFSKLFERKPRLPSSDLLFVIP